jgi:hypothetical protein
MPNEAIDAPGPNGLLRVEFVSLGDRYRHLISLINSEGKTQPLLESIEGTATDDWPPSPPFQSLSIQTLPDRRTVALLVGMAGGTHWSASIEPITGKTELLFDIACRHAKDPQYLGSQYKRLSVPAQRSLSIDAKLGRVSQDKNALSIEPTEVALSGTTRWKFAIRFLLNSEL